ncbi:MAG: flagellar FlbD family protein [Turicibacter sp.]
MIKLQKLNHVVFYLNVDLIERIEEAGDTLITLVDGKLLRVIDKPDVIVERIKAYKKEIYEREVEVK